MEFTEKFSVARILAKAKLVMTHLQGFQNHILEELSVEQSHLAFLEISATELKNSRRTLRRHFLQNLIGRDTKDRDYSARSSMTQERVPASSFNQKPELNEKADLKAATSNYPSYYNLSSTKTNPPSTEFQKLRPFLMNKVHDLNLYSSTEKLKSDSLEQVYSLEKHTQIIAPTKDIAIPEVENDLSSVSPHKKEGNPVHRRMNSPKAASRLVDILNQISKAKQNLAQPKADVPPTQKPSPNTIREIKSLVSSPKQNGRQEMGELVKSSATREAKPKQGYGGQQKAALGQQNASISISITQYGVGTGQHCTSGIRNPGIAKVRSLESYRLLTHKSPKQDRLEDVVLHKPTASSLVTPDKRSVGELIQC